MAKFCNQCGRRLEEGEVCTCRQENAARETASGARMAAQPSQAAFDVGSQARNEGTAQGPSAGSGREAEWLNKQKDVLVAGTKNVFAEIGPILRSPVSRVRELSLAGNGKVGRELIFARGLVYLIAVLGAMMILSDRLSTMSYGMVEMQMPYMQAIIGIFAMTVGVDYLEAVLLKSITGAFGGVTTTNTMLNVIGARGIYDTILFLVALVFGMMAIEVAVIIMALFFSISIFMEISIYLGNVQMNEDKSPYAFFVTKLCMMVIISLVAYLLIRSAMDSALGEMLSEMI